MAAFPTDERQKRSSESAHHHVDASALPPPLFQHGDGFHREGGHGREGTQKSDAEQQGLCFSQDLHQASSGHDAEQEGAEKVDAQGRPRKGIRWNRFAQIEPKNRTGGSAYSDQHPMREHGCLSPWFAKEPPLV